MTQKEMPIFTRTFDFLTWILPATNHFPKAHRRPSPISQSCRARTPEGLNIPAHGNAVGYMAIKNRLALKGRYINGAVYFEKPLRCPALTGLFLN